MNKIENVTRTDISALETEAREHGDSVTVALCGEALRGDAGARAKCERIIVDARSEAAYQASLEDSLEDGDNEV